MNAERVVTIAGFVLLFAVAGAAVLLARIRRDRWATFAEALSAVIRRRSVRVVVLFVWFWLGWHFLAR